MRKTAELMKKRSRAYFVFSFRRKDDFMKALKINGLQLNKERSVVSYRGQKPNLFLSECDFHSGKNRILSPLVLYDDDGSYSQEAESIFEG
jgi:tRNA1(Val) A37 N6-methylase TrmN6